MTSLEMTGQKPENSSTALVVGGGSIGQRHAAILRGMGHHVMQVSNHLPSAWRSIPQALENGLPDYAVVSSPTSQHLADLNVLRVAGFKGPILVEKPICAPDQVAGAVPANNLSIAYQLRFHPVIQWLKRELADQHAISAQAYVGQYLPSWRPDRDYRKTESASRRAGGGALNDLSHELDLMDWLFGNWQQVAARGGRGSDLEIDTDDHFALLCSFERCHVATIELNYLDRAGRRRMVVNTSGHTYEVDLVQNTVRLDNEDAIVMDVDRDGPIRDLHLSVLSAGDTATDLASACRTMALIEAALVSSREQKMVSAP